MFRKGKTTRFLSPQRISQSGVIEEEFRELPNQIVLKTASVDNKSLNGGEGIDREKIDKIKSFVKNLGISNVKFRVIKYDYKTTGQYRIYTIAHQQEGSAIIAIREDILVRADIGQIKEILDAQKSKLENKRVGYSQELVRLFSAISNEDKINEAFYKQHIFHSQDLDLIMSVLTDSKAQFFSRKNAADILEMNEWSKEDYEKILPDLLKTLNNKIETSFTRHAILNVLIKASEKFDKDDLKDRVKTAIVSVMKSDDVRVALPAFEAMQKLDPRYQNVIPMDVTLRDTIEEQSFKAKKRILRW